MNNFFVTGGGNSSSMYGGKLTSMYGMTTGKKMRNSHMSDFENPVFSLQEKYLRELDQNYASMQKHRKVEKFRFIKAIRRI